VGLGRSRRSIVQPADRSDRAPLLVAETGGLASKHSARVGRYSSTVEPPLTIGESPRSQEPEAVRPSQQEGHRHLVQ
jgi:hypothetical protein